MKRMYLDRNIRTVRINAWSIVNTTRIDVVFIMRVTEGYYLLDIEGLNAEIQNAIKEQKQIGIVIDVVCKK